MRLRTAIPHTKLKLVMERPAFRKGVAFVISFVAASAVIGLIGFWVQPNSPAEQAAGLGGFKVCSFDSRELELLPFSWKGPDVAFAAGAATAEDVERVRAIVEADLARHPEFQTFVATVCDRIVVAGSLSFRGVIAGGTSTDRVIYVATGEPGGLVRRTEDILATFYHELAGLLFIKHHGQFPHARWQRSNPQRFAYISADAGLAAVRAGQVSLLPFQTDLNDGFLCSFSRNSLRDDFVMYIERACVAPFDVARWRKTYPAVDAKYRLAIEFLRGIDRRAADRAAAEN